MDRSIRPPNFSWVEEGKIAAMAYPSQPGHFKYLQDEGVAYLVSLTPSKPKISEECNIRLIHIPVNDFTSPTIGQIEEFLSFVDTAHGEKKGLAVHCQMGKGRCGTMLACYLVRKLRLSGPKAIQEIRSLRPGSIETRQQEDMVEQFYSHLEKTEKL